MPTFVTKHTLYVGTQNAVVMGRKTWEGIAEGRGPLAGRLNIVLSHSGHHSLLLPEGVLKARSLQEALDLAAAHGCVERVFVIGGAGPYAEALARPDCATVYHTQLDKEFPCDAHITLPSVYGFGCVFALVRR